MLGVATAFSAAADAFSARPPDLRTGRVQYVEANAEATALPAGTFDVVGLQFVLHEVRRERKHKRRTRKSKEDKRMPKILFLV